VLERLEGRVVHGHLSTAALGVPDDQQSSLLVQVGAVEGQGFSQA